MNYWISSSCYWDEPPEEDSNLDDSIAPTEGYDEWYPSSEPEWYDSGCTIDYDDYYDEEPGTP